MKFRRVLRWVAPIVLLLAIVGSITLYAAATVTSAVPVVVTLGDDVDHTSTLDRAAIEASIEDGTNRDRSSTDRETLQSDPELRAVARYHSRQMAERGFVGHEGPDGVSPTERYDRFGLRCPATGENVHYERIRTEFGLAGVGLGKQVNESVIASEVLDGWRSSQPHHENLLRAGWDRQGVGIVMVDSGPFLEVYATQNFCGTAVSITVTPE